MRKENDFNLFFKLVLTVQESTATNPPTLPRKRKAPERFEIGTGEGYHNSTVEEYYMQHYYEALDCAICTIQSCFNQPGYNMYCNLEGLLIKAANQQDFQQNFKRSLNFMLMISMLVVCLLNLLPFASPFPDTSKPVTLADCLDYLRSLLDGAQSYYSEVCKVAKVLLVMPATNAFSERCFSAMRRIKSYLCRTLGQERLKHLMLLHLHKEKLDKLDLVFIANEFVSCSEHRLSFFGKFDTDS